MGSVTDPCAPWILKTDWMDQVLAVIKKNSRHTFFLLTKFPGNLSKFKFPQNLWVGISIDRQERVKGLDYLKQVPNIGFVSFEPLLEKVEGYLCGIDWIIIGGCTGRHRFIPPKNWVDSLITEARKWGIAVFLKDNLHYPEVIQEWPEGPPNYHDDHEQIFDEYEDYDAQQDLRAYLDYVV